MTLNPSTSSTATIDNETLEAFAASLGGALLRPGDDGYDAARSIFNGMIDRRPALIARCAGTGDVIKSVRFAREHRLVVSVRGGGHNVAGNAICDGGLMIDLTNMKAVRVDPKAGTARAQGGATWRDYDRECQAFGLASTGGLISSTGIGGLTLGGGFGWLGRSYGLACDNLISADVVLADGTFVTASATENDDLFWGLRGGGGNFGVVTSFEYQVHPVNGVYGGLLVYPFDRAKEVLRRYRDFNAAASDALSVFAVLMTAPDVGAPVCALLVCYNGPVDQGEAQVQPLKALEPMADMTGPMPYEQVQTMLDNDFPFGLQNYWKSEFLSELSDDAIDAIVDRFAGVTSPLTGLVLEQFGGAYSRVAAGDTAFTHRDLDYNMVVVTRWEDPADAERHISWTRDLWRAVQPFAAGGVYVNYLEGGQEGADRIRQAYGPNYERLAALKQKYDPTNFFRINQNIAPQR